MAEFDAGGAFDGGNSIGSGLDSIGVPDNSQLGPAPPAVAEPTAPPAQQSYGRIQAYENRPQYNPANPMQDRIDAISAGRARLQRGIDNPLRAFLKPREWQQDLEKAGQLDQQIQQSQQAIQKVKDDRETALNGGMDPAIANMVNWSTANDETKENAWTKDLAGGSFNAYRHFTAMGDRGKAIIEQQEPMLMPALGQRNEQAQSIIDQLDTAARASGPAYVSKYAELDKDGSASRLLAKYAPGFTVPQDAAAWQTSGKGIQGAVNTAKQAVSQYDTKQSMIGGLSQNITDKDEAAAVNSGPTAMGSRGPIEDTVPRKLPNGEYGSMMPAGSVVPADFVKFNGDGKWGRATEAKIDQFNKLIGTEQSKGAIEQVKKSSKLSDVVNDPKTFKTALGEAHAADNLSAAVRSVVETSNASGNASLNRIIESKYGPVDTVLNVWSRNISAVRDALNRLGPGASVNDNGEVVINGKVVEGQPRLGANTIQGYKDVAKFELDRATKEAEQRLGQAMHFAGRNGIIASDTTLDDTLRNNPILQKLHEEGRQSKLQDMYLHKYVNEGTSAILLRDGSTNPMAKTFVQEKLPAPSQTELQNQQQRIVPSPGHENPPQNGAVLPATTGGTKNDANVQLAYAKDGHQGGLASNVAPADPNKQLQSNITPNGAALLSAIRGSESNGTNANSYNLIVGGKRFANFDDHPGEVGVVTKNGPSTAAGAYQFTKTTWDEVSRQYSPLLAKNADGKVAFTPQNQDKAAWLLAQDRYAKTTGGNLEQDMNDPAKRPGIMKALSGTWTSLPGGSEPNKATASRMDALGGYIKKYGGAVASAVAGGPVGAVVGAYQAMPEDVQNAVKATAIDQAPAIGSTAGAILGGVGGTAVGGPVGGVAGGMAGGAAGGAAGQAVKNYMTGNDISKSVGREAALGAVGGIVPEGRPLLGAAARVVGGAGVSAGSEAAENPDAGLGDLVIAGAKGGAVAALGETGLAIVGRGLGMAGDKIFSKFRASTQQELAEAGETIARGKPEPPTSAAGVPVSPAAKAAHDEAVTKYEDAVAKAKDHGIDPEHLAYSVTQATKQGEAVAAKPVFAEKADIVKGYNEIKKDVADTGVGTPKQAPLTNGPVAMVGNHPDVPKTQFAIDRATQAENNITRPAKDWSEKYQQLFDERSKLLEEERAAYSGNDPNKATTLRAIADNVRMQQAAAANYIFGPQKAQAVIAKLESLDRRYAQLMDVTHGGDLIGNMSKPGKAGADARAAFAQYAAEDPAARQMAKVLLDEKNRPEGSRLTKYAAAAIMAKLGIPHVAATVIAMEGPKMLNDWALRRAAGGPVSFKQLLAQRTSQVGAHLKQQARAAAGRASLEAIQ